MPVPEPTPTGSGRSFREIFLAFLRLGCTSFGGPVAHLGYFRAEFVERRRWLADDGFGELLGIAQSLPGPASSQLGFAIGLLRGGVWGGLAAWLGFTAPSAVLMLAFGLGRTAFTGRVAVAILHGLQLVAVAVVAQAALAMQKTLAPDRQRLLLVVAAAGMALLTPGALGTPLAIALGALAGVFLFRSHAPSLVAPFPAQLSRTAGALAFFTFAAGLLASLLPYGRGVGLRTLSAGFFRAGALVFGGGHVVLPLLDGFTVARGWISQEAFLSGYGAAQAVPGPLFTFAAYLGAAINPNPHPLVSGVCALLAIFLPGLLLMTAALAFWSTWRERRAVQSALRGVNASVVGVLISALYRPVWTSTVHTGLDFWLVLAAFLALVAWKLRPWIVVLALSTACAVCPR